MKTIHRVCARIAVLLFASVLLGPSHVFAAVIYDAGPIDTVNPGVIESDLGKTYRIADDVLLAGPATIRCATFAGGYLASSGVGGNGDFTINVHENFLYNGTFPIPGQIVATSKLTGSRTESATQISGTKTTFDYVMNLDTPIALPAGAYWFSIADKTVSGETSWLWAKSDGSGVTGHLAYSKDQGVSWLDVSVAEVSYALHDTVDCPRLPSLFVTKSDGGQQWSDQNPVITYEIGATAFLGSFADIVLTETVPERTKFEPGASTPGWNCSSGGGARSICTFDLGDLTEDQFAEVDFATRVDVGTPFYWAVYNEVVGQGVLAPELLIPALSLGVEANGTTGVEGSARDFTQSQSCITSDLECLRACIVGLVRAFSCDGEDCLRAGSDRAVAWANTELALAEFSVADWVSLTFTLYHLRDRVLTQSRGGERAIDLYYALSPAMSDAILGEDSIRVLALALLESWRPLLEALASGSGVAETVTQEQIDDLDAFLDALRAEADADLADAIDRERARLNVEDLVGGPSDGVFDRLTRLSCEGFEEDILCGDVTGDCAVSAADALRVLRMAVGVLPKIDEADLDGNGIVTAPDALRTLRIAVGVDGPTTACNVLL